MSQPPPSETLPIEPGHVMRREYYEQMARQATEETQETKQQ